MHARHITKKKDRRLSKSAVILICRLLYNVLERVFILEIACEFANFKHFRDSNLFLCCIKVPYCLIYRACRARYEYRMIRNFLLDF